MCVLVLVWVEGVAGKGEGRKLFSCYACVFIRFLRLLHCAHGLNYVILCYKHTHTGAHTQLRTLAQVQNRRATQTRTQKQKSTQIVYYF